MTPTAVVYDPMFHLGWSYDIEETLLAEQGVRLVVPQTREESLAALPEADVVIVDAGPFGYEQMVHLKPGVAGLICYSVGMNQVVLADAAERGIPVRNLPNYATEAVSDHTITMLVAANRHVREFDRLSRGPDWNARRLWKTLGIRSFGGQTLGIIGAGRIGKRVAAKARGLGYRTIANDPFIETTGDPDLPLVSLPELLSMVDAVAICCNLNETSAKLLNAEAFALMKPGMILANCARGGIIDEHALASAMRSGVVASAGLDVRAKEPPDPNDDPLSDFPNLIQTPHVAWISEEAFDNYHREAASVTLDLLRTAGRLAAGGQATR